MIRRQYRRGNKSCYFNNFLDTHKFEESIENTLKPYQAIIAKSKHVNHWNIKWYDEQLYVLFVLRWS